MKVVCPKCSRPAAITQTRFGARHSCCGLWSWGGKELADAETHEARKRAHAAFDPLWTGGVMSRTAAYKALAEQLGLDGRDCHMSLFNAEMANRVPAAVMKIMGDLAR